ncbi:MAG: glycoside hydrolase family 18 protein [Pseudomonadota bacterium]|nr:glycoside hydrolase family 18 protein [Pseudomonadota bacterium]
MLGKIFIAVLFCIVPTITNAAAKPIVMGYWENWGAYQDFPMPNNAKGSTNAKLSAQLTIINAIAYAFLEVAKDGSLQFGDAWSDLDPKSVQDKKFCNALRTSCPGFPQKAGLGNFTAFTKTHIKHHVVAVGGAGHDKAWENAFVHPEKFIASLKTLVTVYKIDWLDIDYEPIGGVPEYNISRFIELIHKIRLALPSLTLSYPIPANFHSVENFGKANWQKLSADLNYISIMGYDMHGSFDGAHPYTALHSALVDAKENDYSIENTLRELNNAGVANSKIILGMPMYGRAVGGVVAKGINQLFTKGVRGDLDQKYCRTHLRSSKRCDGTIQYKTLVDQNYTAIPVILDKRLVGVYAYDAKKNIFVSYDNPASAAAKTRYALDKQLAGVMFWALRFDKPIDDPQSILAAVDRVILLPK